MIWLPSRLGCARANITLVSRARPYVRITVIHKKPLLELQIAETFFRKIATHPAQPSNTIRSCSFAGYIKISLAKEVIWISHTHIPELWAQLRGRDALQGSQLLLVRHRPHQGEAVPVREQRLDRLPDLQPFGAVQHHNDLARVSLRQNFRGTACILADAGAPES